MRVVVAGLVATYPVGGVAWDYLQYVLAFHRLGCDVLYLEDTGRWLYDPQAATFTPDAAGGAGFVGRSLAALEPALAARVAVRAPDGTWHGWDGAAVARFCAASDLVLNLSGACWLRDAYRTARVVAYVDTDPGYSQAMLLAAEARDASQEAIDSAALVRSHDVFFTLGEHVGQPDCRVPTAGLCWLPTRQPIVLDRWPVSAPPADGAFTTVLSWSIEPSPPVIGGRAYGGKDVAFLRVLDLPGRTSERLEAAISGAAPRERIAAAGWRVVDGQEVSTTVDAYQRYLVGSTGEFSVAKDVYVGTRSGWFSTRSAAYLAAGRPCVLEDTGWSAHVPPGPGLRPFTTVDEAAAALAAVRGDLRAASAHARATAESSFDGVRICERLLADAGLA